jgi:hypothetical protein
MVYNNFLEIDITDTTGVSEVVSLSDAKAMLRLSNTSEDSFISSLIIAGRVWCERYLNKSVMPKSIVALVNHDGKYSMPLAYLPLGNIAKVEFRWVPSTTWQDITTQTSQWEMQGSRFFSYNPGQYRITYTTIQDTNNIEIIKLAIKQFVAFYYENRGDEQLYQLGSSKEAVTVVPDIIENTLKLIKNNTWFG